MTFDIFTTGPGGWYLEASREQAHIWILDVDGDRVILAWVAVPGVTRAQMNDMTQPWSSRLASSTRGEPATDFVLGRIRPGPRWQLTRKPRLGPLASVDVTRARTGRGPRLRRSAPVSGGGG